MYFFAYVSLLFLWQVCCFGVVYSVSTLLIIVMNTLSQKTHFAQEFRSNVKGFTIIHNYVCYCIIKVLVLLNILIYQFLILQVMPPYYENTSVIFCSDHTHFGTRIDHTLHYLGLGYPQNIFHFSNLPFHFKVLIQ